MDHHPPILLSHRATTSPSNPNTAISQFIQARFHAELQAQDPYLVFLCNNYHKTGPRDLDCNLLITHNRSQAQHKRSRPTIETHGWESFTPPAIKSNNTTNRKLKQRLILRSQQQFEVLPQRRNTRRRQQLRDLALANNSLQELYRMEELLERSPTLPCTYQTTVGNDGNSPEKLTVNSTRARRTEVDNQDNISLSMGSGA
ncbi:hypothetical protein F511_35777 [Dorcoceras hygrometricum]|uniref:Uncharacterized protein n=1 Tax=Dorcoceras hygrometricum TaxID=472368 RepID=A0A2Z7C0Z8_9LAMI|nr:hypothetical protein F511_35777 [Dorcoceras hygrometricum]